LIESRSNTSFLTRINRNQKVPKARPGAMHTNGLWTIEARSGPGFEVPKVPKVKECAFSALDFKK
ncbi:MAG: hypothetical protein KAV83_00605, partial [Desulfobacterales bacterium]|nr:hypothetical protein [Desulfobacterales bacterium]